MIYMEYLLRELSSLFLQVQSIKVPKQFFYRKHCKTTLLLLKDHFNKIVLILNEQNALLLLEHTIRTLNQKPVQKSNFNTYHKLVAI